MRKIILVFVFCSIFLLSCQNQVQNQCNQFDTYEEKIDCCIHSSYKMPIPDCNGEWAIDDDGGCFYQCDVLDELEFVEECDALSPCPIGECYVFPDDSNAICYEGNPCDECDSGKCVIAESYPMQVFCE